MKITIDMKDIAAMVSSFVSRKYRIPPEAISSLEFDILDGITLEVNVKRTMKAKKQLPPPAPKPVEAVVVDRPHVKALPTRRKKVMVSRQVPPRYAPAILGGGHL